MASSTDEVKKAKKAFRILREKERLPLQRDLAAAANVTQGYVSKVVNGHFKRLNPEIRKILEYSKMTSTSLAEELLNGRRAIAASSDQLRVAIDRILERDPDLGRLLSELVRHLQGGS